MAGSLLLEAAGLTQNALWTLQDYKYESYDIADSISEWYFFRKEKKNYFKIIC